MCTSIMAFTVARIINPPIETEIIKPASEIILPEIEIEVPEIKIEVKNHDKFLDDIGFRESSNNYKAVNQFGYLGKYQFGRRTLKSNFFICYLSAAKIDSPAMTLSPTLHFSIASNGIYISTLEPNLINPNLSP